MTDKTFVSGTTIDSTWLNDVNRLTNDAQSTAVGKGAALIGSNDAGGYYTGATVEAQLQEIGAEAATMPDVDFWSFFSAAQKASAQAYNFAVDCTTALQNVLNTAFASGQNVRNPAGGFLVTGLTMPGASATRGKPFVWRGAGTGEPFVTSNIGGTVIKSVTDAPVLQYVQDVGTTGNGQADISYIRFDGTSTTPVIKFEAFYGLSELHHCVIYQRGTGGGFEAMWGATADVHNCYALNKDFATMVIGSGRTGVGFYWHNTDSDSGLDTFRKCTSRGWNTAYKIGDGSTSRLFQGTIQDCECSVVYNGIELTNKAEYCNVLNCYFEGIDGGTGIIDAGNYNKIIGNNIFAGFAIGIDLQASGFGGECSGNKIASSSRANTTLINVVMSSGLGRMVSNNTITWASSGGAIAGVSGITISGANPQINLSGNMFSPKINWVGGAGSQQITDNSTSTLSAGSGLYGLGTASFNNLQVPMLNQGAISLAIDGTAITTVTAGVATLTAASDFLITFAGATNITSFTAPNIEGKLFYVRVTNGNCTFVNGAALKMAGAANYTPGANGATVCFKMHANVCWEMSRTAY